MISGTTQFFSCLVLQLRRAFCLKNDSLVFVGCVNLIYERQLGHTVEEAVTEDVHRNRLCHCFKVWLFLSFHGSLQAKRGRFIVHCGLKSYLSARAHCQALGRELSLLLKSCEPQPIPMAGIPSNGTGILGSHCFCAYLWHVHYWCRCLEGVEWKWRTDRHLKCLVTVFKSIF